MNIKEVLNNTEVFLKKYNIPQPRLDAEVLLADLLAMERIKLYVHFDYPLTREELDQYRQRVLQRAKRQPVAYLTGHKEFMSLDFIVDNNVLLPRPETELLVEEIISICQQKDLKEPNIVDVGTGSGAIMVSLGYNIKGAKILGIDISENSLKIARKNIAKYELQKRLKVIKGNLLDPLLKINKNNVDIIVSNPPYISVKEMEDLPPEVKKEPREALVAGEEGLDIYRQLIPQAEKVLKPEGLLILEIAYNQGQAVKNLLENNWHDIKVKKDFAGHERMVVARPSL